MSRMRRGEREREGSRMRSNEESRMTGRRKKDKKGTRAG
jgi:hypothetical protein